MELGTDPLTHRIPLDGVLNLRELGGYPTATGRETLRRRLLRSDDLDKLAPVGQKTLIEYGLRTVIDLRDPQEAAGAPDVFAATAEGVGYYHLPFFDDEGRRAGPPDLGVSKGSRYLAWLDLYPENIREIFRVMVAAGEGVTLFHCAAGKDRTGLVAGLMLALADVADDVIDADYAISAELLVPRIAELRAEAVLRGEDMILFERRAACLPETMQEVLDGLRAKYGGAEGYLRLIGLSEEEIATLNVRLLE